MVLVSAQFLVVLCALLAASAVVLARRGLLAEAVCVAVSSVGVTLMLAATAFAHAARGGNILALALVVGAYVLAWACGLGGAAGAWAFARQRGGVEAVRVGADRDGGAL